MAIPLEGRQQRTGEVGTHVKLDVETRDMELKVLRLQAVEDSVSRR
jgi:hypothetical protein